MDDRIANELVSAVEKLVEKLDKLDRHLVQVSEELDSIDKRLMSWDELMGGDPDSGFYLRVGER